jgi:DNA-binding transcriptional regulator YdaS (Cro superfamily)
MKEGKSLRRLAEEIGVSHSYLSQVLHGKRPASEKVQAVLNMVSMVSKNQVQQRTENPRVNSSILFLGTNIYVILSGLTGTVTSSLLFSIRQILVEPQALDNDACFASLVPVLLLQR